MSLRREGRSMIYTTRYEAMNGLLFLFDRKLLRRRASVACARGKSAL